MTQDRTSVRDCVVSDWNNCYDESWKGIIVDEAFSHPAKFSFGLIQRIVRHGLAKGYWRAGETLGDPFGGVALGGIVAGCHGLNWVGVELEPRFVELGNQNLAKNGPLFVGTGSTSVKLVQGDSRRFAEIVGEVCGAVTSPPYSDGIGHGGPKVNNLAGRGDAAYHERMYGRYGDTPGQIDRLPVGDLDGVITSPPYAESLQGLDKNGIDMGKLAGNKAGKNSQAGASGYGSTSGNIGNLKSGSVDGIVTSPPYARSTQVNNSPGDMTAGKAKWIDGKDSAARVKQDYADLSSEGNIAQDSGETYWTAMKLVYAQMRLAMKSGAIAALVVKDYVAKKARVPLCDQTCQLLESLGFDVFERTRCHLVKETRHPDLFGGDDHVETTERKSFFRRLAEKNGSPPIDWEEVIWARADKKPA